MDELGGLASLIVIGDGEERRLVADRECDRPWMRALGFINQQELATWYGAADIVVLPSDYETWGLTVNEAMAAGAVPIVSDAVGCGPDLVEGGPGAIFRVGDIGDLASCLHRLLDRENRRTARRASLRRIHEYGLDATVHGIEAAMFRRTDPEWVQ
jgi:glycosyltransferase involved in cell wall biosynthesis